jgi:accessory colonization factor AcfC
MPTYVCNPTLADQVPVEPQLAIYRDTGIALTKRGEDRR